MNKREKARREVRRMAYQELLDRYNSERITQLERLRSGRGREPYDPYEFDRNRDVPYDLWYPLRLEAHDAAKRKFDAETRAKREYDAETRACLGLCKCEENPA